ncbi:MFS transporter [Desulfatiglans anilini]|uniref:MFS transporter n=1 Tax=Desulfatiglans anilini TaxID=90728 RepID=UPI000407E1A6|nr:MFS transporter [Desulfatiglans anilini]
MNDPAPPPKLMTAEFTSLCLIMGAAFCNISVFYSFYHYLETIGIPTAWRGFLVGLEPMSAFILRLVVLPWLNVRNAMRIVLAGLLLLTAASWAYLWVDSVAGMIVLRIIHGGVFVLLTSALIALAVIFIPQERSGQGFSVISIASIIPYAVIPPLSEALLPRLRNEADIYAAVSIFSILSLLLLAAARGRIGAAVKGLDTALMRRLTWPEIRENLRRRPVATLLFMLFLIYFTHATFFYFLKNLTVQIGTGEVGLFFSVSMIMMLVVRLTGTTLFDRLDKRSTLRKALALLIPCVVLLPHVPTSILYYVLAAVYGTCMGVGLPLLNALLFSASPPALKGLNTNLALFTMDLAYFCTPYLGGVFISFGAEFRLLFYIAGGSATLALAMTTGKRSGSD